MNATAQPIETPSLFVVMLGGRAPGCRIELHDVAFAVGQALEDTHEQLLAQWFGQARGLHVDAWMKVEQVQGYRVSLRPEPPASDQAVRLYFVNIGGYQPGELAEQHGYMVLAASGKAQAKAQAKRLLLQGFDSVHKDDLYEVDDLLEIGRVGGLHIHLVPSPEAKPPEVVNGYFPLPRQIIEKHGKSRA
ncbi:MAG: DUF1543 domain-containing protein [Wenzhouxiangella sp.]